MKRIVILLTMLAAVVTGAWSQGCDTVQLPYTADFSQCWTATGGATIIDSNHASISAPGNTITSPWIMLPAGTIYFLFDDLRDTNYVGWYSEDSIIHYEMTVEYDNGALETFWFASMSSNGGLGNYFQSNGGLVRITFTQTDTNAAHLLYLTDFVIFSYNISLTLEMPEEVYVGDTVSFASHVVMEDNDTPDIQSIYFFDYWWNNVDSTMCTVITATDSTCTMVWHQPGQYLCQTSVYKFWPHQVYEFTTESFYVWDTATVDCDNVTLPYSADFSQCWTSVNGASIIDPGHASISMLGQQLVSPWIEMEAGMLNYTYTATCEILDAPAAVWLLVEKEDGTQLDYRGMILYQGDSYVSAAFQVPACRARFIIKFNDGGTGQNLPTVVVSDFDIFQSPVTLTMEGPDYTYIEDTVSFTIHASYSDAYSADDINWSWDAYRTDTWSWASDEVTLVDISDSLLSVVFHTPGPFQIVIRAYTNNAYNGHYSDSYSYAPIFVTTHVDCDSITLPYTADFSQCWTAEGGATIIAPDRVSLASPGQRIVGPWMETVPGTTFVRFDVNADEWDVNALYTVIFETEDGVELDSRTMRVNNNTFQLSFNSPGGRIRMAVENTGSVTIPSFYISNIVLYQYNIDVALSVPDMACVGDTVRIIHHHTLQNGDIPDNISLWIYDRPYYTQCIEIIPSNQSVSPTVTVIDQTDTSVTIVWNTSGRFDIGYSVYKYNVYGNYYAFADCFIMNINIMTHPAYVEDSIYYTSVAKDTVIGCHQELHNANLPASVRVICDSAFFNLPNLSSIDLPDELVRIGKMAFAWNYNLTEVTLPRGLKYVGDNAFWSCDLHVVNFNADSCLKMCDGWQSDHHYYPVFIGNTNLTTINIGENVKRIPAFAFSEIPSLRGTIVIPDAVRRIGKRAFYHYINNWTDESDTLQVVIGRSVYEIGDTCFPSTYTSNNLYNQKLTSVISLRPVPPIIHPATFYLNSNIATLTVPCGTTEDYRNAYYWYEFTDIREDCNGIDEPEGMDADIRVTAINGGIVVDGTYGGPVKVYDVMGHMWADSPTLRSPFTVHLPAGVYMVRVGDLPARKVVVLK